MAKSTVLQTMAGSVMSAGRASIERHVFLLQHPGSSTSWPSKLELDPAHPLSKLQHHLDRKTTHVTAIEPVCPLSLEFTRTALSENPIACLDFNGASEGKLTAATTVSNIIESSDIGTSLDGTDLMVCLHGARDQRCGVLGPALIERLSQEAVASGLKVRLWGASHYGGHRFAPNALVFPGGHWFGMLDYFGNDKDLLSALSGLSMLTNGDNLAPVCSQLRQFWRGRMGMTKEDQLRAAGELQNSQAHSDGLMVHKSTSRPSTDRGAT